MNVLFVLYGGLGTNSAIPLMLHARELHLRGHRCAVAIPDDAGEREAAQAPELRVLSYERALAARESIFPDARAPDIVHAWTPRENVRRFVTAFLAGRPVPWLLYHEDNEDWIARRALAIAGIAPDVLLQHSEDVISQWTGANVPHVLWNRSFIGLADAAIVIQPKLAADVPPWVPWTAVRPGVDLRMFAPREPDPALRRRCGVAEGERVIVYPGGLNDFTRPGLEALCRTVGVINDQGVPCRLLRCGPVPIDFRERLPESATRAVTDLGEVPRAEMPALLALADVFVQPGKHDLFEDRRLPGKLPELFAMGRPVVLPDTNIADLVQDGVNALVHRTGTPDEMARICMELFAAPERCRSIGEAGRRFAEAHFDPAVQASQLEDVYRSTVDAFDPALAARVWTADAAQAHPTALLVRKLRLLARSDRRPTAAAGAMLEAYADLLDFHLERTRGLETGMEVRDVELGPLRRDRGDLVREIEGLRREIAALREEIARRDEELAALRASLSWRMTQPIRMVLDLLFRPRTPS